MEQKKELKTPFGPIPYILVRKKVKNINLRIKSDGTVMVSAGLRVPLSAIEGVLMERSQWILRCVSEQKRKNTEKSRYALWGEPLDAVTTLCAEGESECCIVMPGKVVFRLHDSGAENRKQELWMEYLRREAEKVMVPLFDEWSEHFAVKYGAKKQRLTIKPMTSRWGSRSKKTERIALNLYLVTKPKEYLEYTIVHELCHLLRMDHSRQFHQLVEANLPGAHLTEYRMRHESPLGS